MITKDYVQQFAYENNTRMSKCQRLLCDWRDIALERNVIKDPGVVIAKIRETAAELHLAANQLEADCRKAKAA